MSTLAKRLLIFFVGIPIVVGLVLITSQHHILLQIAIIVFSLLAANEFYNMANKKTSLPPKPLVIIMSGLLPTLAYLFILFGIPSNSISWFLIFFVIIIMGFECFTEQEFTESLPKIAYSTLCILYCGYSLTFISLMAGLDDSLYFIILYLLFVFFCDSAAWFFGILFGKNNRGIFKASPNKSIAGFLGGILSDIVLSILAKVFFPDIFAGGIWKIILLAFVTAIAAIIGDLIESVFKRSCDVKDSGNIIPGRGGVLDSIDSIVVAAPVFYIGIHFLYFGRL